MTKHTRSKQNSWIIIFWFYPIEQFWLNSEIWFNLKVLYMTSDLSSIISIFKLTNTNLQFIKLRRKLLLGINIWFLNLKNSALLNQRQKCRTYMGSVKLCISSYVFHPQWGHAHSSRMEVPVQGYSCKNLPRCKLSCQKYSAANLI